MNVFYKVTLQTLQKNKTRTVVTIIGIMLSTALICAVTTFVSSIQKYVLDYYTYRNGDWHGSVENEDFEIYEHIRDDKEIEKITYGHILGYAKSDSQNEYKPYFYVIGGDESNFFNMLPIHLTSGAYPKNENELLIPSHAISNGGMKYKVGDNVTLEIGDRMLDGFTLNQGNPCYFWDEELKDEVLNQEVIKVKETRTYTIVGIYERPLFESYTAPGYTAITVSDTSFEPSAEFDIYFKMKNPSRVYDFMRENRLFGPQNSDVLNVSGAFRYSNITSVLIGLSAIVIGLIMFGSVALIYNAFAISVSERTKQFGLLSSVGATKKQLKEMVLFEAFAVSTVGIPLGIGVGITGIGITLLIIGSKFTSIIGVNDMPMRICVSWQSIVIAVVVALITVLISAWIPSKRATDISAVEAIRQSRDIKIKNKAAKTAKLTYKLFGLPGVLASKHYKRNRKKYRTTVISLFMSIVLFVSASSFIDYLMESITGGFAPNEYDIYFIARSDEFTDSTPDELLSDVMADKYVTSGAYLSDKYFAGQISEEYLTDEFINIQASQNNVQRGFKQVSGYVHFVNDEEFDKLIKKYNLKKEDYYDKENPLSIAFDTNISFDVVNEKYITVDTLKGNESEVFCQGIKQFAGYEYTGEISIEGEIFHNYENPDDSSDEFQIPYEEGFVYYTLKSGKTVSEKPFFLDMSETQPLSILYPLSMYEYVLPEEIRDENLTYFYYLQSDNHTASYDNLKTVLTENGIDKDFMHDEAANEEENRNVIIIIQVFSYGFVVLISLIASANVFNTISTNINLRRREFAMLKSVGMSEKGFNKMMNFECLLYGSKALLLGLPTSAVISYMMYNVVTGGYELSYRLPMDAIGIAVLSVFLVVFATMLYSMSKIKKENPIDALKNENL